MNKAISPSVETTKVFILIKIPRNLVGGPFSLNRKISALERGLQESLREAIAGKLIGPFRNGKMFLKALKKIKK